MRFIEWDTFEFRVNGERLNAFAQMFRVAPVESLALRFENGRLRVEGSLRKFISIPFRVDVTRMEASGATVRVPLESAAAFGAIPIPRFLFSIVSGRLPREMVRFEEPATFVISLDHFLPDFVSADIQKIWIIEGGLMVTLGGGGADLPPPSGAPAAEPASGEPASGRPASGGTHER